MKNYNLSEIMRNAWKFKKRGMTMSQALKTAWTNAKCRNIIRVYGIWDGISKYSYFTDGKPCDYHYYDVFDVELPNGFEYLGINSMGVKMIKVDGYAYRIQEIFLSGNEPRLSRPKEVRFSYIPVKYKKLNDELCCD